MLLTYNHRSKNYDSMLLCWKNRRGEGVCLAILYPNNDTKNFFQKLIGVCILYQNGSSLPYWNNRIDTKNISFFILKDYFLIDIYIYKDKERYPSSRIMQLYKVIGDYNYKR